MAKRNPVASLFRRIFHARKIIVVSDRAVDYYPMSLKVQAVGVVGMLGLVSWISYSTGNYVAAQSQINAKDRAIAEVHQENAKINNQFSLLKQDIVRMKEEDGGDLSDYAKFVIQQYSQDEMPGLTIATKEPSTKSDMVFERIHFLENRIASLKKENDQFVTKVRDITGSKIGELEKAITLTGISRGALEKKYAGRDPDKLAGLEERAKAKAGKNKPQGGPFVPVSTEEAAAADKGQTISDVEYLMDLYAMLELMPLAKPVSGGEVTSGFGVRTDPFNGHMARHTGTDFSSHGDMRVRATADGTVVFTGWKGAYGNLIEINHGMGITTRYGHLSAIKVSNGAKIKKGQIIAIEGSTGRSTGTHLHYEVRFNDRPLNPMNFLKAGMYVSQK